VNKRTLLRDITVLREILQGGLEPIPGPPLGWRLPEPKRHLRTNMQAVLGLVVGMKLMRFLSGRSLSAQLQPLISELRHSLPELQHLELRDLERRVHVVESGQKQYVDSPRALEVLGKMLDAVLLQQPVDLRYLSPRRKRARASPSVLMVQVLCVTIHRGAVYFVVDALSAAGPQPPRRILLGLDRITEVHARPKARQLSYPRDFDPQSFFASAFGVWTGDGKHHISLLGDSSYADAVRERTWHASQRLEELSDGSIRLSLQLGELAEVCDWILGMGEHVRVESPPELVERVKTRLGAARAQYG
jgi:predicted DNA-binding transcriptional regulator YafY